MKATREGKRFMLASFLIAVAAVNTGNNLIYLILALMLSFLALSVLILRVNLHGLSLGVSVAHPVFAGDEAVVNVFLKNTKRLFPSYSVNVTGRQGRGRAYFPFLPASGGQRAVMKTVFAGRGLCRFEDCRIQSGFPFILFSREVPAEVSEEVLVYPKLVDTGDILAGISGREAEGLSGSVSGGGEIYALREFREGDDWRRIHWKASAKTSGLVVKEYAEYETKKVTIIVDNVAAPSRGDRPGRKAAASVSDALFETTVSLAGSLSKRLLEEGYLVRVFTAAKVLPYGGGDEQLFTILDVLSLVGEEEAWKSPEADEDGGEIIVLRKSRGLSPGGYAAPGAYVIHADAL